MSLNKVTWGTTYVNELINLVSIFTPDQFWSSGISVACVRPCVCVCVHLSVRPCVNPELVRMITCDSSQDHQIWTRGTKHHCWDPYVFLGNEWPCPSMSNLNLKSKFVPFWASLGPERLYRIFRWSGRHEHDETIHDTVTWSAILHSFVCTLLWCINIMSFREFRVTVLSFGCFSSGSTERIPDCMGRS